MPSLGADMEAATVVQWFVAPGDRVERGQIVVQVESEKGILDVEIFEAGVIEKIIVGVGEKVPVGTVLATLTTSEQRPAAAPVARPPVSTSAEPLSPALVPSAKGTAPSAPIPSPSPRLAEPASRPCARRRISPAARVLADTNALDLEAVEGSGPDGALTLADVRRAIETKIEVPAQPGKEPAAPAAPAPPVGKPQPEPECVSTRPERVQPRPDTPSQRAAMRVAIGALMARSKREIPHYYLSAEIDLHAALAWLEAENRNRAIQERLLPAALLLKASALAAREVPEMNGFFTDGAFRPSTCVHLGVAVSLRDAGLIAPAIHDADRMSLSELMASLRDLVKRARAGGLRASEMSDPTITVTNLGEQGVETVFGVIYPPQVAIVGFGKIVERARAISGMIAVHPVVTVTLSADHRVSDGHRGALFLAAIERLLQKPEAL